MSHLFSVKRQILKSLEVPEATQRPSVCKSYFLKSHILKPHIDGISTG